MSRPDMQKLAEDVIALCGQSEIGEEAWSLLEDAARALVFAHREMNYLAGQRDAAHRASNMAIRRLAGVLGCLWPDPITGPNGQVFDGTPEMKVMCHDRARIVAKQEIKELPYDQM